MTSLKEKSVIILWYAGHKSAVKVKRIFRMVCERHFIFLEDGGGLLSGARMFENFWIQLYLMDR